MDEEFFWEVEKVKLMSDFKGFPYEEKNIKVVRKKNKLKTHALWKLTTLYNKYSGDQLNRSYEKWKKDLYFQSFERPKIAIYTCITNGYDMLKEPLFNSPNIDYYVFTDTNIEKKSKNWNIINTNNLKNKELNELDDIQKNRFIKMHPHIFLKGYDYSLYVDGNVTIISDITPLITSISKDVGISLHRHIYRNCLYDEAKVLKILGKGNKKKINKQIKQYNKEGFPKKYGLLEATIILADLKNPKSKLILDSWWEEFVGSKSYRDQLSLPYILWRHGINSSKVASLGENLYRSSKFFVEPHI